MRDFEAVLFLIGMLSIAISLIFYTYHVQWKVTQVRNFYAEHCYCTNESIVDGGVIDYTKMSILPTEVNEVESIAKS